GSIGGRTSVPFMSAYTSSKFAMRGWTDALRLELLPDDIQVVLVEPGAIATDIWGKGGTAGRRMYESLPAPLRERYGQPIQALLALSERSARRAIRPDVVAEVLERDLRDTRPKSKYLVGSDAHIQAFFSWLLPDRWFDALLLRNLG